MNNILVLCAGGCEDYSEVLKLVGNILGLLKILSLSIPILLSVIQVIKLFRGKIKKKIIIKRIIKYLLIGIIIFAALCAIDLIISWIFTNGKDYDEVKHCWCK